MTKSERILLAAFARDSLADLIYLAFAREAEKQGYPQIARFFRAAADNLQNATPGETVRFQEMYPEIMAASREEGKRRWN